MTYTSLEGALVEQFDYETKALQPIGHISPGMFRVFPDIEAPDEKDFKNTAKLKFGLKHISYSYSDSTVGLELEFTTYDHELKLLNYPQYQESGYIHPMTEFFNCLGEIGTDPMKGGIYSDLKSGKEIHFEVNKFLAGKNENIFLGGAVPVGRLRAKDVSTHNEYLRRISLWLSERANISCIGISDPKLRDKIKHKHLEAAKSKHGLHEFTSLYGVTTFQPMIFVPGMDGDFCIDTINLLNSPAYFALMALMAASPFYEDQYTGYRFYRGELRHIFKSALYLPEVPSWHNGTRDRVIKHLRSGEGLNLGRAILSSDNICLSNGLFRIRPDIGGIEICGLDSHPNHLLRAAVAEIFKLMIYYNSVATVDGIDLREAHPELFTKLDEKTYYSVYQQVTKHGVNSSLTLNRNKISVKEIVLRILATLSTFAERKGIMSKTEFDTGISQHLIAQFEPIRKDYKFDNYFSDILDEKGVVNLSELLISRYEECQDVNAVIREYITSFKKAYNA